MPEPARPEGDVALGGQPMSGVPTAGGRLALAHVAGSCGAAIRAYRVVRSPTGIASDATLVAHPADIGSDIAENDRARLQFSHQFPGMWPVVIRMLVDGALFS